MPPRIQYARSGDVHIAYAAVGDGPPDVVFVPGFVSSIDLTLEGIDEGVGAIIGRVSRFARLTTFDKRGTGLSDRSVGIAGLEARMDDVRSVMDAVGIERCWHLLGMSEGGPMSILFAATFPERTQSLTLYGSFAVVRADRRPPVDADSVKSASTTGNGSTPSGVRVESSETCSRPTS